MFELFRPPIATPLYKYFLTKLEKGIKKRKILCYFKSADSTAAAAATAADRKSQQEREGQARGR